MPKPAFDPMMKLAVVVKFVEMPFDKIDAKVVAVGGKAELGKIVCAHTDNSKDAVKGKVDVNSSPRHVHTHLIF